MLKGLRRRLPWSGTLRRPRALDARIVAAVLGLGVVAGIGVVQAQAASKTSTPIVKGALRDDAVPREYLDAVRQAATLCRGVTAPLLAAQTLVNSSWDPTYTDPYGAKGLGRFTSSTWQEFGIDADGDGSRSRTSPADALAGEANYLCWIDKYMAKRRVKGDRLELVLAGYVAGPYAVRTRPSVLKRSDVRDYIANVRTSLALYVSSSKQSVNGADPISLVPLASCDECTVRIAK